MSSSSSEDNDHVNQLKEAIAADFISDVIYQNNEKRNKGKETPIVKSLRPKQDEEDCQFNELGVTKEFKQHVAKHLVTILDDSLKSRIVVVSSNAEQKKRRRGGVRLFSNSVNYLKCPKDNKLEEVNEHNNRGRRKHSRDVSEEREEKSRSVAVESDYVLSKKEIKHWSKRTKAQVFRYKSEKNGQLCLIE